MVVFFPLAPGMMKNSCGPPAPPQMGPGPPPRHPMHVPPPMASPSDIFKSHHMQVKIYIYFSVNFFDSFSTRGVI